MSNDVLLEELESTANFMRGMQFDPRIPSDTKIALVDRAQQIDEFIENHLKENGRD